MATPSKTTKIGKYDVIDIIGRGGMGVVYKARDPYLDRLVAIKMMNVDIHEDSDFMERFYREAKATASLQHPNIVTVYDLGEYQNRPFLVMQYLEGYSLEALLRGHRAMTLVEKLNIIVEVCQGLAYAHQRGIIHRDIKPGNIMVLSDGSVKIVDFGIARLGDNTLTRTGQIVGSLYYMPSEQLRDKPVDTRADIYSTGVVLYQLLTDALPFEGESTGSTLAKILSDDPPPFRQFALSYPPELEAITLRALAKDRDQRFPTAEAMAIALAEVQDRFKQDSIKEYLTKAELLQQSNELQQAQECLLKVLKLDRQHTSAAKQLSAVRAKLQAQLSAERVRQLKRQAEDAYGREEFDAALAFMKQAIELDNNPELQTLRANIEKSKAEVESFRKAIARAEAAQRSGDLDSAKSAIDTAFSYRPDDSNVRILRRAIERDLEERERQRQVEGLLDEARKQMVGRRFTAALDLLKEAQKLDPSAPQLRVLLERLASEHQQEKRRRELERFNHEVQEAIDRDDYKAAPSRLGEQPFSGTGILGLPGEKPFESVPVTDATPSSDTGDSTDFFKGPVPASDATPKTAMGDFTGIFRPPSTTILKVDAAAGEKTPEESADSFTGVFVAPPHGSGAVEPQPEFTLTFTQSADPLLVGRTMRVTSVPFLVGRANPADLKITSDPGVSREHARIEWDQGAFTITDLNTANGTYLNGRRIRPGRAETLPFGAVIRLSNSTALTFSSEQFAELPDLTGQVIGDRFQLNKIIHNGSKTALYEASDSRLPQNVAVKILSPSLANYPGYLEQFRREAETAARLRHPRICKVIDSGQARIALENGRFATSHYLAMELMEGSSLSEHISKEALFPLEKVVICLDEVTDAIDHAHRMGVIHSGIKLSSVVFDRGGRAYITDFGMASRQDDQAKRVILGAPEFLAPEQWEGLEPTPQVDQYSLAVLTYMLVTGSRPFEGQQDPQVREESCAGSNSCT